MAITWTDYVFPLEGIADTDERLVWYQSIGLDEDFDIKVNLSDAEGNDRFRIIPNNNDDKAEFRLAGMHLAHNVGHQTEQRLDRVFTFLDNSSTSSHAWARSTGSSYRTNNVTFSKGLCKNSNIHIWKVTNCCHDTYNNLSYIPQCMVIIDKSATNTDGNTVSYYFIGGDDILSSHNYYYLRALLSDSEQDFNAFSVGTGNDNQFPNLGGTSNIGYTDSYVFRQIVRSGVKGIFYYLDGGRNHQLTYIPRPIEFRAAGHDWISLGDRIVAKVD